jgi:hypothetical protein
MNDKIAGRTLEGFLGVDRPHLALAFGARLPRVLFVTHGSLFPHRSCDCRSFLRYQLSSAGYTTLEATETAKGNANGFLGSMPGRSLFGARPVDCSVMRCASSFGSRGHVFERSGTLPASTKRGTDVKVG